MAASTGGDNWGLPWLVNRILDVFFAPFALFMLLFWAPAVALLNTLVGLATRLFSGHPVRGKAVLITGASSGIGENLAYEFSRRGAKLLLAAQREHRLDDVADRCRQLGASAVETCAGDVRNEGDCRYMVDTTVRNFGRLDILVCNAGIGHAFLFEDAMSIQAMRQVMDVDFWGSVWLTLHALPFLRRSQGQILVNSSIAAFLPFPRHSIYNGAKSALVQFFDTLRTEKAGLDIGITIAFPGATQSELTAGKLLDARGRMVVDQELRDLLLGPQPMLRASSVAKAMVNAVSRHARYVIVPFWASLFLLFRAFAPDVLSFNLRLMNMPMLTKKPLSKMTMEAFEGKQLFYQPPATSQHEAEMAVKEGRTKHTAAQPAMGGAGGATGVWA